MTHPIIELQTKIIGVLNADAALSALIGAAGIFDMPPKASSGAHIVIVRHDILSRDFDIAPGNDHRIQLRAWVDQANRADALELVDRVVQVIESANLSTAGLKVTNIHHQPTDTAVARKTGRANATVTFSIFSEPTT